jgi:hypothetical protein
MRSFKVFYEYHYYRTILNPENNIRSKGLKQSQSRELF